jgi:TRAP-type C4-dicarboxylate transport system substrate-binding protein
METHGIYALPGGALENGFRQICSVNRRVRGPDDLAGYRMRVPAGRILAELFEAFGATPVTVNIDGLHAALKEGGLDGHENPLAIVEVNRLHGVAVHVCMTNHVWSGFNLIANLHSWHSLSDHAQDAIHRATRTHVARQRSHTVALNLELEKKLPVEHVPQASFRARVGSALYAFST